MTRCMNGIRILSMFLIVLFFYEVGIAQDNSIVDSFKKHRVESINISGIKQTKPTIVERELLFHIGDSLNKKELEIQLLESRFLLQNTNLFSEVELHADLNSMGAWNIRIELREKLFIYPLPKFSLLDRNFNEWWYTFDADLNRIIYGIEWTHLNLTGRADPLTIRIYNGFTRTLSMSYAQPNVDKKMKWGLAFAAGYTENLVLSYKTANDNRLQQLQSTKSLRETLTASATLRHRNQLYNRSSLSLQLSHVKISDQISDSLYNPNYLNSKGNVLWFPDISYRWQHLHVDNINFPLMGNAYGFGILKRGIVWSGDLNMLSFDAHWKYYVPLKKQFFFQVQSVGQIKLPFKQAYMNQRAFGYGDFYLSGLDRYVVDGVASVLVKTALSKKIWSTQIKPPFKSRKIPTIPLGMYLRMFTHHGYSYLPDGNQYLMNNRWLYTAGIGLDLISLYDMRFGVDYSFNQFGEKGLFLQWRNFF
jgi:outer membrane protein assembly factor BamA